MKFQLTCYVDEKLIGPLTELIAPHSRVIVKLIEDGPPPPRLSQPPSLRKRPLGITPKRGAGAILGLQVVASKPAQINTVLKAEFVKIGLAPDGAGATLSKLRARGYLRHGGKGEWALTPKGEAALRRVGPMPIKPDEPEATHDNANG